MVPLSAKIMQRVHDDVLDTVTCGGRNMWHAVLYDIDQVCVCVCVSVCLSVCLSVHQDHVARARGGSCYCHL